MQPCRVEFEYRLNNSQRPLIIRAETLRLFANNLEQLIYLYGLSKSRVICST